MNSDPKEFGPGKWDSIHDLTCNVYSLEEAKMIIFSVKKIIYSMKCECVQHAMDYLDKVPIENSIGIPDEHGCYIELAKWGWIFHNNVNIRLGKQWMSWDDFEKKYILKLSSCRS